MALIRLGGLVTQISGKIGGQTLGTSASGSYIKNTGTPRKAITLLQQTKMQRMATTAQAWRALTQAQRDVYISASPSYPYLNRVGETKFYSGYAIFCKLRNNLLNIGSTPTPAPLPLTTFPPLSSPTLSYLGGIFTLSAGGTFASATYRFFCSRPASKGVTQGYKNKFFIRNVTSVELSGGLNVSAELTAKFGAIAPGQKIYWRLDGIDTTNGQVLKNMASGFISF
jgi:hypothetical protein